MLTPRQLFQSHVAQTSPSPLMLEITHAHGCYMTDVSGKKYLDLISGISVSALGHSHPAIIDAICGQAKKHLHLMVYGEFVQYPQVQYAELLAEHLPGHLNSVYFTSSGTEATEGAMKLAKRVTGRPQIISCINAYHGSSQGALSLAGREELKNSFRPLLPGTFQIRYNNFDDLKKINHSTAAVFAEPVQSEAGAITGQQEWFEALHNRCKEKGALLVLDEIQTGMGRTGTLWAFQSLGIEPDILLLGKAFGGGLPLGAFIASDTLMQQLTFDPVLGHITTFGGHPLSCTAGLTALRTLINSGLIAEVAEKEQHFREIFSRYPVYGKGLLLAVDLGSFDRVQTFIARAAAKGFITDWFLFNEHCIRISPPLIITHEEIESVRELAGIHI